MSASAMQGGHNYCSKPILQMSSSIPNKSSLASKNRLQHLSNCKPSDSCQQNQPLSDMHDQCSMSQCVPRSSGYIHSASQSTHPGCSPGIPAHHKNYTQWAKISYPVSKLAISWCGPYFMLFHKNVKCYVNSACVMNSTTFGLLQAVKLLSHSIKYSINCG